MLEIFLERLRQGARTGAFPEIAPEMPTRFRGRPFIDEERCSGVKGKDCRLCSSVCPVDAIKHESGGPALDMGICTFCGQCVRVCPWEAVVFTTDWRLATSERAALIVRPARYRAPERPENRLPAAEGLQSVTDGRRYALPELPLVPVTVLDGALAHSFRLRQVTAAGCGACEADLNVLTTPVYDLGRFGMDFVASPRHADAMALTGPVPENMRGALDDCLAAMPLPRIVIAVGTCAISGGLFHIFSNGDVRENTQGAPAHLPVNLFIPGCPPHPYTILDGLLRFLGRKTPVLPLAKF